jgi:hypothetical protein
MARGLPQTVVNRRSRKLAPSVRLSPLRDWDFERYRDITVVRYGNSDDGLMKEFLVQSLAGSMFPSPTQ